MGEIIIKVHFWLRENTYPHSGPERGEGEDGERMVEARVWREEPRETGMGHPGPVAFSPTLGTSGVQKAFADWFIFHFICSRIWG